MHATCLLHPPISHDDPPILQLGLFAIPLQLLAIAQGDGLAIKKHGFLQGFHRSTWLVVAIDIADVAFLLWLCRC